MALLGGEIMQLVTCSPRGMARAQHQLRCTEGVRPFLVRLNHFAGGPRTVYEWDKQQPISEELLHTLGFLYQHLPSLREVGAEMWPLQPSTVYYRWMRCLSIPYNNLVLATWDAARSGVAITISVVPGVIYRLEGMKFEGVSTIITFEDTPEAQAHREAAGEPVVMRLLRRMFEIPIGRYCCETIA
jgi:hypothetical protein